MIRKSTGIMLNIDINSVVTPFLNETAKKADLCEKDLYPFVDVYAGTQVSDVLFCTFCQFSLTPSTVFGDTEFKYNQTTENGFPVDYHKEYEGIHTFLARYGIDPVRVWLKRCRDVGLRPWMSIRMNDCHCPDEDACFLRSDFFYEAREKGWTIGDRYGYFRYCFNYAVPEVRRKMLDYLAEQLSAYDTDGLELDFEREIYCFDYLNCPDAVEIMTAFVGDVKALVTQAEKRLGHPIELSVRLGRDEEQCKAFGFDAARLTEVGVERIIVTPRWATCDSDMPIAAWKTAHPDIPITAGIEILVNRQRDESSATPAVTRAYSAHYLDEGSDGIYLFNHFVNPSAPGAWLDSRREIFDSCGSMDTAKNGERLFVVTYQDIAPEGYDAWHPLPVSLNGNAWEYTFRAGAAPANALEIIVGLGKDDHADALHLSVDGVPVAPCRICEDGKIYAPDDALLFKFGVPLSSLENKTDYVLTFSSDTPLQINFLAALCR